MPDVEIGGRTVTVERFSLAKAMRVMTLLGLLQKQVPEVTREWARFRTEYRNDNSVAIPRLNAKAQFGDALEHITEEEWERAGHVFEVPGSPSQAETFFALAPFVYERAEETALRLLALIAMDDRTVVSYVETGALWARVDEFASEVIKPAGLDEVMELVIAAAEVIDGQVLQKAKNLGDRAGNVARLFGIKTKTTREESETSSEQPVQPSTVSVTASPMSTDGNPDGSSPSPTTSSETSPLSTVSG